MSARFFKIFSGVFLAHLVLLNVGWWWSAPLPRPPATFTYEGALPAGDNSGGAEDVWQKGASADQFTLDYPETFYSKHWIKLREMSKPL